MSKPPERVSARRAARLQSVQALYQIEQTGASADTVAEEFLKHPWAAGEAPDTDAALLNGLVIGVASDRTRLDELIAPLLAEGWTMERLPMVLAAILRLGAFELSSRAEVPARAVIDEYVTVAHEFLDGEEPKLVNAVLDRLARTLRGAEMGGKPRLSSA